MNVCIIGLGKKCGKCRNLQFKVNFFYKDNTKKDGLPTRYNNCTKVYHSYKIEKNVIQKKAKIFKL